MNKNLLIVFFNVLAVGVLSASFVYNNHGLYVLFCIFTWTQLVLMVFGLAALGFDDVNTLKFRLDARRSYAMTKPTRWFGDLVDVGLIVALFAEAKYVIGIVYLLASLGAWAFRSYFLKGDNT